MGMLDLVYISTSYCERTEPIGINQIGSPLKFGSPPNRAERSLMMYDMLITRYKSTHVIKIDRRAKLWVTF